VSATKETSKNELIAILSEFSGIPKKTIRLYGDYTDYGNKQRYVFANYTIVRYKDQTRILYMDDGEIQQVVVESKVIGDIDD